MHLILGADVCPINKNEQVFSSGVIAQETIDFLAAYDLRIANLECPLIVGEPPATDNCGVELWTQATARFGLKKLGFDLLSLANNHIMDCGVAGMKSTIQALQDVGIPFLGVGDSLEEAARPHTLRCQDNEIMVFAFTEHYFSAVSPNRSGANYLEVPHIARSLLAAPSHLFKLVLLHGGSEGCAFPSPVLRDICHFIIELGAHAVIVQHTHCLGAYETYRDGLIVYGQGNFIFDYPTDDHSIWTLGALLDLEIDRNRLVGFQFVPFRQEPGPSLFRILTHGERQEAIDTIQKYHAILASPEAYGQEWNRFCQSRRHSYNQFFSSHGRWYNKLRKILTKIIPLPDEIPREKQKRIFQALRCVSRLEELKTHFFNGLQDQ